MKKITRSVLALLLALVMLLQLAPATGGAALAEAPENQTGTEETAATDPPLQTEQERKDYRAEDVLFERTELREAEVKHFQLRDGEMLAVAYGLPVHYETDAGVYEEIDNRLTLQNPDGSRSEEPPDAELRRWQAEQACGNNGNAPEDPRVYRNGGGLLAADFAVLSNAEHLVTLQYKGCSLRMTPLPEERGALGPVVGRIDESQRESFPDGSLESAIMPKNGQSALLYEGLWSDADLQYILTETALKENILIREREDSYSYSFLLELEDLRPAFSEDGGVELLNEEDERILCIPAAWMADAAGAYSDSLRYELQQRDGALVLTVKADPAWVNAEERVFPVTIDPTAMIDWDTSIELGTISSGSPNLANDDLNFWPCNYELPNTLGHVGQHSSTSLDKLRTLIHVGTLPTLPENSTIIRSSLKLRVYCYYYSDYDGVSWFDLEACALTNNHAENGSWCKYHTWNDCPALSDAVLDFHPVRPYFNDYGSGNDNYFFLDVTREAIRWYSDPSTNYGICLRAAKEAGMDASHYGLHVLAQSIVSIRCPVAPISSWSTETPRAWRIG